MQELATRTAQPLLKPQPPAGEEARVAATLEGIEQRIGFVPDGLRLFGISPPLLESYVSNIGYFNSGERLSPVLMTMIRYLVSSGAQCSFCIDLNEGFLGNMGVDVDKVRAARSDIEAAPLPEKEKFLLRLAVRSVTHPEGIGQADLDAARRQGWSDRDIFDAVAQAASNRAFNYVMRTFKVEHQGAFA